ncbi:MAG: penicillin-binding protein 1C [Verrucomicrobia bacterium]|nr:penicillin-binding protein 1C [Verrucomicrobiota bacterium]
MKTGRRWLRICTAAALLAAGLLALGWLLLPRPALLEDVSFSAVVRDRDGGLLRVGRTADDKFRVRVALAEVAPAFVRVLLFQEDRHFRAHPGVNPFSALRAARGVTGLGPPGGGASTISMQLARLRGRLPTRSFLGKLQQMYRALQFERHYTKDQILEAYLNLAPFGGNVEGIGAAALLHLGKPAAELTLPECVSLAVIPQSPSRRGPRRGAENVALAAAHARLWQRLGLDPLGAEFALQPPPRPFRAPHFVQSLGAGAGGRIETTLAPGLQRVVEQGVATFLTAHRDRAVRNAAALLVHAPSGEVLAQVGSADFHDASIHGQVDGTRRRRSPGSALKPFIYALALEHGLIHAGTILPDAPRRFGDYEPENFDRAFAGPLRAGEALARSRNVPAIELCARLGPSAFPQFLRQAGLQLPKADAHYGLTLALGGAEVTMEELVRLYGALANGGEQRNLRRLRDLPAAAPLRLLSPEASYLTLEMLREHPPGPGLPRGVAWKTGTSNGFRDAWCVAVLGEHVLAVWVGNFDGSWNPAFIGRGSAGTLLFHLVPALAAAGLNVEPLPPARGLNVRRVELCAVSGGQPTPHCRHCAPGWFIPGVSPIARCEVHREVLVDAASGLRVPFDDGTRVLRREVHEFWPHDLQQMFRAAGVPRRQPPPFLPGSARPSGVGDPPRILSPAAQATVLQRGDEPIWLRARAAAEIRKIYWFADRRFLGTSAPLEPLAWTPAAGTHQLEALDDQGRVATAAVEVW